MIRRHGKILLKSNYSRLYKNVTFKVIIFHLILNLVILWFWVIL
jgi:hypothetical protein